MPRRQHRQSSPVAWICARCEKDTCCIRRCSLTEPKEQLITRYLQATGHRLVLRDAPRNGIRLHHADRQIDVSAGNGLAASRAAPQDIVDWILESDTLSCESGWLLVTWLPPCRPHLIGSSTGR